MKRLLQVVAILVLVSFYGSRAYSQQEKTLTLDYAIRMALKNNRLLKISEYKVDQNRYKLRQMKSKYLPRLTSDGTYSYSNNVPLLTVDQGSFGVLPGNIPLPPQNFTVLQGKHGTYSASVTLYQPISQLIKVQSGVKVSGASVAVSRDELQVNRQKILMNVRKLYYGIQHTKAELVEKQAQVALAKAKLEDARIAHKAGKTLEVSVVGLQADVLDKKHDVITCRNKLDDYWYDFRELTGIRQDEKWTLAPADTTVGNVTQREQGFLQLAMHDNPTVKATMGKLKKADYAVEAARRDYLPDIGGFARYTVQRGIPITPHNMAMVGVSLKWNLFTFGERANTVKERDAIKEQARLAYDEQQDLLTGEVEKAFRRLQRSRQLIQTAKEAVRLRGEQLRLAENQRTTGLGLSTVVLEARADLAQSKTELIGAVIRFKLAQAKLNQLAGQMDSPGSR